MTILNAVGETRRHGSSRIASVDRNQVVTRRRANCVTSSTGRYGDSGCRTDGRTVGAFGKLGSVGPAKGHFRLTSYCSLRTRKFINRLFFHRRTRFGDQVVERSGRNIDFPAELLVAVGVGDTRLVLGMSEAYGLVDIVNGLDLAMELHFHFWMYPSTNNL